MLPWQQAKKWQEENSEVPFEYLLGLYIQNGYVWSSPSEFILARPAFWDGKEMLYDNGKVNCWVIQLGAGKKPGKRFFKVTPYRLKYLTWQRRGNEKWHVWEWDTLEGKVNKNGKHKNSRTTTA
tara:strand:+ start:4374 stop:4745 length:372 start_codon:yes stop_codon:yes gene_type:complete